MILLFHQLILYILDTTDNKVRDKNYNTILIKKQQKHQQYYQVKLINMNIVKKIGEEVLPSGPIQVLEQAIFTDSPHGKLFEKQIQAIGNQGGKHIKAIEEDRKRLPGIMFLKLCDKIFSKIDDLSSKIDSNHGLFETLLPCLICKQFPFEISCGIF